MILLELVLTILLMDFVSGLVHWMEDTFWTEETPVIGYWVVKPNVLHHVNGYAFVRNNWLQSSWILILIGIAVFAAWWLLSLLSWHFYVFALLGVNANQIHKWSHCKYPLN